MREISAVAAALLLAAGVAAAVSAVTVRVTMERVPRIASVRLSSLTADYVTRALRDEWRFEKSAGRGARLGGAPGGSRSSKVSTRTTRVVLLTAGVPSPPERRRFDD